MLYKSFWIEISKYNAIVICTHINIDGDSIGTAYALKHLILASFPQKQVKISGEAIPAKLTMVDENEKVTDEFFNNSLKIVVDTASISRVWDQRVKAEETLNLDHHKDDSEWKIRVGSDNYPAAGEVLYELIQELKLPINDKVLIGIFVAIWTDTYGLSQRNISARTHDALSWIGPTTQNQLAHIIELSSIENEYLSKLKPHLKYEGDFAYLISKEEVPNAYFRNVIDALFNSSKAKVFFSSIRQDNIQRCSLRSDGAIDVSVFAEKFGGGGHLSSAGFKVKNIEKAKKCLTYIKENI